MRQIVENELAYWQDLLDSGRFEGIGKYYVKSKIKVLKDLIKKHDATLPEEFTVKITKASKETYWYVAKIGTTFTCDLNGDGDYHVTKKAGLDPGGEYYIKRQDCKIV